MTVIFFASVAAVYLKAILFVIVALKHSPSRGKRQQRRSTGESATGGSATAAAAATAAKRTLSSAPEAASPLPQPSPSATFGGPFPGVSAPVAVDSIDLVVDELPSEIFRGQVGRSSASRRQTSAEGRLQRQDAIPETEPGGGPPTTTSVKRDGTKKFDRLFASDAPSEGISTYIYQDGPYE